MAIIHANVSYGNEESLYAAHSQEVANYQHPVLAVSCKASKDHCLWCWNTFQQAIIQNIQVTLTLPSGNFPCD